jgi:hypothetical protein
MSFDIQTVHIEIEISLSIISCAPQPLKRLNSLREGERLIDDLIEKSWLEQANDKFSCIRTEPVGVASFCF